MRAAKFVIALLATLIAASAPGRAAEPVTIRVGWVAMVSNLPSILMLKPDLMQHQGKSYSLEATHYGSTPTMVPALATDALDIATLSYSALAVAIENAGMSDLRVVADEFQDGAEGYYSNEFMVLKDSPIRSVEDLRGKVLASNGVGGAVDMALRVMLRRHDIEDKRDVTLIEVSSPNQRAVLADRKVDLITSATPYSQDPRLRDIARPLFTQRDAVGRTQMILWVARSGFIAKNRAALVDFLEDTIRVRRFFADPANHKAVIDLVTQFTKQPADRYDSWLFTKDGDYYRDPDDLPDLGALQSNVDMQHDLGFLPNKLDIGPYADLGPVKEAAARIGR